MLVERFEFDVLVHVLVHALVHAHALVHVLLHALVHTINHCVEHQSTTLLNHIARRAGKREKQRGRYLMY